MTSDNEGTWYNKLCHQMSLNGGKNEKKNIEETVESTGGGGTQQAKKMVKVTKFSIFCKENIDPLGRH